MKATNSDQFVNLGPVGGMGGSATPGGYNQGNMIAGVRGPKGDSSPKMAGSPGAGKFGNILVNSEFPGAGSETAAPKGMFAQGDMVTAKYGPGFPAAPGDGDGAKGGVKTGGNILGTALDDQGNPRGAPADSGYAQGDEFAAISKKKNK